MSPRTLLWETIVLGVVALGAIFMLVELGPGWLIGSLAVVAGWQWFLWSTRRF